MKFHTMRPPTFNPAQSPIRIAEQATGREVGWVNRYLDREYVRRVADTTLRTWAYNLLHFVRWWESLHHTGDVAESDLTESTKFQSILRHPNVDAVFTTEETYAEVQEYAPVLAGEKRLDLDLVLLAVASLPVQIVERPALRG